MPDGNIAFKVTWVYGEKGPFTSPCAPEGRDINIRLQKKTWCRQPQCPCYKLYKTGNLGLLAADEEPCYDAVIFKHWCFGGGMYHTGSRKGQPIPLKYAKPGKLAFFTSRRHDMTEDQRIIIGCFEIGRVELDDEGGVLVVAEKSSGIKVPNFDHAPRFWDFHAQKGGPRWKTGLFRYLSDQEAQAMYRAVKEAARSS